MDNFFARAPELVAADLLGSLLLVDACGGYIVETEAYARDDEASHSFRGLSRSNAAMFGAPGTCYVYRSYGLHWCLNFVCETGSAVLIRALHPTHDLDLMAERRGLSDVRRLCRGPGNLCQALSVTMALNERPVSMPPFSLLVAPERPEIVAGPRIGITKATERNWRFAIQGSPYMSRPLLKPGFSRQFDLCLLEGLSDSRNGNECPFSADRLLTV
jgi:DNA-3-methyladenine glycosylase